MKHSGIKLESLPERYRNQLAKAFPSLSTSKPVTVLVRNKTGEVIRQRIKPKLNKLETAFQLHLKTFIGPEAIIYPQAISLELANGCKYTPDFFVSPGHTDLSCGPCAYEVKGPHVWDDAKAKVKMAARVYPWVKFFIYTRKDKNSPWHYQEVLP